MLSGGEAESGSEPDHRGVVGAPLEGWDREGDSVLIGEGLTRGTQSAVGGDTADKGEGLGIEFVHPVGGLLDEGADDGGFESGGSIGAVEVGGVVHESAHGGFEAAKRPAVGGFADADGKRVGF